MKLNLGAGGDIKDGWINHDLAYIPGIDVVHDLNKYPWPWPDNSVDEIKIHDVLEHLNDFILAMEEIWRVLKPGGMVYISVPYYNSWSFAADPTHKRGFHEITFRFFDPESSYCKSRFYYTNARFKIEDEVFILAPFNPYFVIPLIGEIRVRSKLGKFFVGVIGNYFITNLIQDLRLTLKKTKVE